MDGLINVIYNYWKRIISSLGHSPLVKQAGFAHLLSASGTYDTVPPNGIQLVPVSDKQEIAHLIGY